MAVTGGREAGPGRLSALPFRPLRIRDNCDDRWLSRADGQARSSARVVTALTSGVRAKSLCHVWDLCWASWVPSRHPNSLLLGARGKQGPQSQGNLPKVALKAYGNLAGFSGKFRPNRGLNASGSLPGQCLPGSWSTCCVSSDSGRGGRGTLTLAFPLVAAKPAAPPRTFKSVQEHGRRPGHHCDLPGHGGSEDPRATPL